MSTRAQIGFYEKPEDKVENFEALLYRHSDGYPSGVLPEIMPFLAFFKKARGLNDTEYLSGRLLQYLCNLYDGHSIQWAKESKFGNKEEIALTKQFTGTLGNGISKSFHWDIEYLYCISPEGVKVYDVSFGSDDKMKKKLIGTVPVDGYEENEDYIKLLKD